MSNLIAPEIKMELFFYSKDSKTFIGEASTIRQNFLSQIWDDSADQGFVMVSHHTGKKLIFLLTEEQEFNGDDRVWKFKSHEHGKKPRFEAEIFND